MDKIFFRALHLQIAACNVIYSKQVVKQYGQRREERGVTKQSSEQQVVLIFKQAVVTQVGINI